MEQPPPFPTLASPAVMGPSPGHLEQIALARKRGKIIRRAASVAVTSGWTIALFGAMTLIGGIIFFSVFGILLGIAMCVLAHFELRGAKEIRRLNPDGPRHLAINQIVFGLLLAGYAIYSLLIPSQIDKALNDPQLKELGVDFQNLSRLLNFAIYGSLIAAAVLGCGGTAWYYASRKRHIEQYIKETPHWITELERAGMNVY